MVIIIPTESTETGKPTHT